MLEQNLVNGRYKKLDASSCKAKKGRTNRKYYIISPCHHWMGVPDGAQQVLQVPDWYHSDSCMVILDTGIVHYRICCICWNWWVTHHQSLVLARHFHDSLLISRVTSPSLCQPHTQPQNRVYTGTKPLYSYPNKDISSVECIVLYYCDVWTSKESHVVQ